MKNFSRYLASIAALGLIATVAGCSSTVADDTTTDAATTRTVIVGTSNDAPLAYLDADGVLTGIDGDIMMAIAETQGWKVETVVTDFGTLIETLNTNRIDILADAMSIQPARAEVADFSDIWYHLNDAIVVPDSDTTTTDYADIEGKTIGTVVGTFYVDYVTELSGGDIKLFDTQATMLDALQNGAIDAAITDAPVASYSLEQNTSLTLRVVNPEKPYFDLNVASATRMADDDLREEINAGLAEIKENGTYDTILKSYGMAASAYAE